MADNVQTKVQCAACRKHLMKLRFSQSTFNKYQDSLNKNRRDPRIPVKLPRCLNCNPQNRSELTCVMCSITKSLDDFSKAQRRKPDDAHCKDCQQEKDDREPDHDKEVEEIKIMDEYNRMQAQGANFHHSSASRLHSSVLSQAMSDRYETETNPGSAAWAYGNDAVSMAGSDISNTTKGSRPTTGSAWDSFPGDGRQRSTPSTVSRSTGFVKQNAVPKNVHQKVQEQATRERTRQEYVAKLERADSGDDDDTDSDDPY